MIENSIDDTDGAYELVYAMGSDLALEGQSMEPLGGKCYAAAAVGVGGCVLGVAACAGIVTCAAGAAVCGGGWWLAACECKPDQAIC